MSTPIQRNAPFRGLLAWAVKFDPYHSVRRQRRDQRIIDGIALQLGRVDSLLDVGCGDGFITRAVADRAGARRVAGVELSVPPHGHVPIHRYNGRDLPFPDGSFEAVTLVDVLHHCEDPQRVLDEAVRVAKRKVVIKDHLAFGSKSRWVLRVMDRIGNAKESFDARATYLSFDQWIRMSEHAKARFVSFEWPFKIHDLPWRLVAGSELHFTATLLTLPPAPAAALATEPPLDGRAKPLGPTRPD
jgi:SAM-dependent methyltransferase